MRFDLSNNVLTLYFVGELNSYNADDIDKEIEEVLSGKSIKTVNLDFSELRYISSAGLRIILKIKQKFDYRRRHLPLRQRGDRGPPDWSPPAVSSRAAAHGTLHPSASRQTHPVHRRTASFPPWHHLAVAHLLVPPQRHRHLFRRHPNLQHEVSAAHL